MKISDALPNPRMTMSQNENSEKTDIPKAQTQSKEGKSRLTKLSIVKQIPNFYLQKRTFSCNRQDYDSKIAKNQHHPKRLIINNFRFLYIFQNGESYAFESLKTAFRPLICGI